MKKKTGFNLVFFVIITLLLTNFSCTDKNKTVNKGILLQTDREFSSMSQREGMNKAFLHYVADSGVLLRNNSYPINGKERILDLFSSHSDTAFILTWEPIYEKISESGDLGYTYGISSLKVITTGEIHRGTYITIWQKQQDDRWKFVLDTGTQGLPDKKE
jgi:ketosteroid isomerase-like protein